MVRSRTRLLVPAVLLALAAGTRAAELEADVARLARPYVESGTVVGMSIGLLRGDETCLLGFGRLARDSAGVPGADSVYEIGSISKVFTGVLLASMVRDGTVRFDQPVAELLPEGVTAPRFGERAITLVDLTTHTSGLPRMPDNFEPEDPANPFADYGVDRLYAFLAGCKLTRAPGESYLYSNLGAGLLGHALAHKAGASYGSLLRERITRRLGLASTAIELDEAMGKRLARGHDVNGRPVANWNIPVLAGAGGIRSTARDMLAFLRANLGEDADLAEARVVRFQGPPKMACGWHVGGDETFRWHNGQTGGYHSFAAVSVEKKRAVVVLANTATGEVDRLGQQLLTLLAGEAVEPPKLRRAVPVDPAVLATYAGAYQMTPDFVLTVTVEEGQLMIQATGQANFPVFAEAEARFFYRVVDAQVTFQRDEDGEVTGLVLHQNGRDMPAARVEPTVK